MKNPALALLLLVATPAIAAVRYVNLNNPAPAPPYITWASTATNIQDSIDVAETGDEIVVTNGVYATGGRGVNGTMTNRVAVAKPVTVRSVNGPEVTVIAGYQVPGSANGDGAVRCVYLTNGAALVGFTLTNGATRSSGDFEREQSGGGVWCASASAVVANCVLNSNSAGQGGGGAYNGTLNNCLLTGNSASFGGGAYEGTLINCAINGNSATYGGGGTEYSTLKNCTLTGNRARFGGGAYSGPLHNCTLNGNSAAGGGGAMYCSLNNCTVTGNSAYYYEGGGAYGGTLNNCIVYYNIAPAGANYAGGTFNYSCTTPLPFSGAGNIGAEPQLASASHLSALSPCRGAGSAAYATGVDIDGEAWTAPPSIGCDEFHPGAVTGPLTVAIVANYASVVPRIEVNFTALIGGRTSLSRWEFDDGTTVTNRLQIARQWATPGDYVVMLRAYNQSYPEGATASITVHVVEAPTHYVVADSGNPVAPYSSWATAATNIQDAVDAAVPGALVLVSNGVYRTGGRMVDNSLTNRVAVTKPLTVRSVNGPEVTVIVGYQVPGTINGDSAVRCVYLAEGTTLVGFSLTNGATRNSAGDYPERAGGGVWCATADVVVSNCVLIGNSANDWGGGASGGTVNNCTLTGNSATSGGGADRCTLNNCVLTGNSAYDGAGASGGMLDNCVLTSNTATYRGGGVSEGTLNNCVLNSNSVSLGYGGGASGGTLNNCTLTGNSATSGGGASGGTLNNCVLNSNSVSLGYGGGACYSELGNCLLTGNSASSGGGAYEGTLINCAINGNSATYEGGGAAHGTLNNCALTGNSAGYGGGGAQYSTLNNCTLAANSARNVGGGAWDCALNNCIVYYNTTGTGTDNYNGGALNYSCTTPLPPDGVGNITDEPQFTDAVHLSAGSPCRGVGSAEYATGVDIDGEAWANPPSIGCDEPHPEAEIGPLSVAIVASYTYVTTGFEVNFTAQISGHASLSRWEFWDGSALTNRPYAAHAWVVQGDYPVVLWAYNESYPDGVSTTITVRVADQPVHYVAPSSGNPVAPYSSWVTAATNIQDAVDVAVPGALVLVTNGVYQTDGRVVGEEHGGAQAAGVVDGVRAGEELPGPTMNRVAVTKPITVRSVNGPEVTVIAGAMNSESAVRCVYLINGAALMGFTLTNGVGVYGGGGVWCSSASAVVSNCMLNGNSAGGGCGRRGCSGGGAYGGTLKNCTLTGNSATSGGGAADSVLNDCVLNSNSAFSYGGGASFCTLNNCTLRGNYSAYYGGGASGGMLNNCTLTGNTATYQGGGVCGGTLNNCVLNGNSAANNGGGSADSTLNNCTLTGNSAYYGGGALGGVLNNCIVYYNVALIAANYSGGTLIYCCTTPRPPGVGNFTAEPELTDQAHLSAVSPCRAAGSAAYASGTDIDGEAWASPPSIGCDESYATGTAGSLSVAIVANYTNVATGFTVNFAAQLEGRASANVWEFGDGIVVSNRPVSVSHTWIAAGDYIVLLRAYNDSNPAGVSATLTVHVVKHPVHYVAADSSNPVAPYSSWMTAATNIQDAVDAASEVGALVLVANGVYQTGGRVVDGAMTNRVAVTKPLTVRSVNGPEVTVIRGYQAPGATNGDSAVRCVYLSERAALLGFTLTNGATRTSGDYSLEQSGGGVWCAPAGAVVSNCVLSGNSAYYSGGGAYGGTLNNCTLSGNSAFSYGGGAFYCTLNNCTLTGNSASYWGGGAYEGTLNNCIVYYNVAAQSETNYSGGTINYSCTTPLPFGLGNFDNPPLFVDSASGNLRLQSNSPCINAGLNPSVSGGTDLDGNSRIVSDTVDVGAYEFQSPQSLVSYAWLQQYGLPIEQSTDSADPDGDRFTNWQEWRAGTDPTNAQSVLRLLTPTPLGPDLMVTWESVPGRSYFLEWSANLGAPPGFEPLATNIVAQGSTTSYAHTNGTAIDPSFYRLRVN